MVLTPAISPLSCTLLAVQFNNNNEYLNASWIPGYKQKKGYIASQGPIPESMPSFWHMVWREGCKVIVMVTNEIEGNKLKCHRYWPSREDPEVTYGAVKVRMPFNLMTLESLLQYAKLSLARQSSDSEVSLPHADWELIES